MYEHIDHTNSNYNSRQSDFLQAAEGGLLDAFIKQNECLRFYLEPIQQALRVLMLHKDAGSNAWE